MQVKLLRAIQERRVRKLGATAEELVDVRLISATHQNLADCVERGKFRQDLYYRLNVIELSLPPLRERRDDIELLSALILKRLAADGRHAVLAQSALQALLSYPFPGNVRELENILERALAFANHGVIEVADLALKGGWSATQTEATGTRLPTTPVVAPPVDIPVAPPPAKEVLATTMPGLPCSLPDHLDAVEREMIRRALGKTHFNRTQAAELLGISFRQLRYRMQRLGINEPE
jgi:two-component system response regulator PilR (NtrC family)